MDNGKMNNTPLNDNDDYKLIPFGEDRIVIRRNDLSLRGAWIGGHFIESKDLSEEYKMRAHAEIRRLTFELTKEEKC
jgi:hypothetical protein